MLHALSSYLRSSDCSSFSFFFSSARDRRDLHSFPTRRSSDLALARRVSPRNLCCGLCVFGTNQQMEGSMFDDRDPNRDRKSTRLNSSHGYISYAVFCLKKKKMTQQSADSLCRSSA